MCRRQLLVFPGCHCHVACVVFAAVKNLTHKHLQIGTQTDRNAMISTVLSRSGAALASEWIGLRSFCQQAGKQPQAPAQAASSSKISRPDPHQGGTPKLQPEVATTEWGGAAFRVLNFELYAKPEGWNRVAAYIGSATFVGILTYFTFSDMREQEQGRRAQLQR